MALFNSQYYKYMNYFALVNDGLHGFIGEMNYLNI